MIFSRQCPWRTIDEAERVDKCTAPIYKRNTFIPANDDDGDGVGFLIRIPVTATTDECSWYIGAPVNRRPLILSPLPFL